MARNRSKQRVVRLSELTGEPAARTPETEFDEAGAGASQLPMRPRTPTGGTRIAYSYLIGVIAGLLGGGVGWALSAWLYQTHRVCAQDDTLTCPFVSFVGVSLVLLGAILALGAGWARLGALWWLWCVALSLLLFEAVGDPSSSWLLLILLVPLAAALITDPTRRGMSRRRAWVTGGIAGAGIGQFVVAAWLALR